MMSVLWQFGILAAILVFGIKVGLASGLANLSKKLLANSHLVPIIYTYKLDITRNNSY